MISRLLRSWKRNCTRADTDSGSLSHDVILRKLTICQALRATSALPGYFAPVCVDYLDANGKTVHLRLSDGVEAGGNNPSGLILRDIQDSCATEAPHLKVHTLLSIASGRSYRKRKEKFLRWGPRSKRYRIVVRKLFGGYDPNIQQQGQEDQWKEYPQTRPEKVFRLGADVDLPTETTEFKVVHYKPSSHRIKFRFKGTANNNTRNSERDSRVTQYRTLEDMEMAVEKLSKDKKFRAELKEAAALLVETRRARELEDPDAAFEFYNQSPFGSTSESEASVQSHH